MRRQDFIEVVFENGMHRRVKRRSPIPTPGQVDILYRMNQHGHRVVEVFE